MKRHWVSGSIAVAAVSILLFVSSLFLKAQTDIASIQIRLDDEVKHGDEVRVADQKAIDEKASIVREEVGAALGSAKALQEANDRRLDEGNQALKDTFARGRTEREQADALMQKQIDDIT